MFKKITEQLNKRSILIFIIFLSIAGFVFVYNIFTKEYSNELYFIDVGQGDSELLNIDGIQILVDGGPPNGKLIHELSNILPFHDRYIDLVVITHPQLDHFGGLIELSKRYKIGLVLYTGVKSSSQAAQDLESYLKDENIQGLKIAKGDIIKYKDLTIRVILPDKETIKYEDLNDSSIVFLAEIGSVKALLTGDIGEEVERKIIDEIDTVDILKVAHHGSKYSSNIDFLRSISPDVSFIQVGKNSYGHPSEDTLNRLGSVGSQIFRTDIHGTIKAEIENDTIKVFTKKK